MRFALIRGTGLGLIAHAIMRQHLETEVKFNANVWFARVPTEANVADIPSIFLQHPFLPASKDESDKTSLCLEKNPVQSPSGSQRDEEGGRGSPRCSPRWKKKSQIRCTRLQLDGETSGTKSSSPVASEQSHLRVQFTSSSSKPGLSGGVGGTSFKTSPPGQKNPNHTVQRFTSLFPALEKRESDPPHQIET